MISAPIPVQVLRLVVVPIVLPGVIAVALFGFTLSYDEFARTLQTTGSTNTLPIEIWSMTTNVTSPVDLCARHGDDRILLRRDHRLAVGDRADPAPTVRPWAGRSRALTAALGEAAMDGTQGAILSAKTGAGRIELAGLYKRFGDGAVAVDGVNLVIEDGSYCCLLGPSGCGKTTILRMIAGHETPTDGEIVIGGENVVGLPPRKRGTAMMFQSYALFPHLSVRDNIAFSLRVRGVRKTERHREADRVIEQVQLGDLADRLPAQLSGGQQQRVALARRDHHEPRVLLLDEPLSALDEFLRSADAQ